MQINWTDEQRNAVEGEKANCLVSAAAGSGKTQVLTGRILHRVLHENLDIDKILVVTFTNAAAAEMRARIAKSIAEALAENPENMHLQKQITLLDSATICTMDSFCLNLLRKYALEAGIDGDFRVGDSTETALLRMESAQLALEKLYEEKDDDFMQFATSYSSLRDDGGLCDLAISLYSFAESMPDPEGWILEKAHMYRMESGDDFKASPFAKAILSSVKLGLSGGMQRCRNAEKEFAEARSYAEVFAQDCAALEMLYKKSDEWDSLCDAIDMFTWTKRRKEENQALAPFAEDTRKSIKAEVEAVFSRIQYTAENCADILKKASPHVEALCRLTLLFSEIYKATKQEKNILDYSDLEHMAISLLTDETGENPSPVAQAIRDSFDEIYIDEYQDSNDVQEKLFSLLSGESIGKPNMFMVGDMKQSIYGFRKTSPALFIQKSETYKESGPYKKIFLSKNFRSRPEILDFVNHTFSNLMSKEVGGIAYTKDEMLYPKADYAEASGPFVSFAIVDSNENAEIRANEEALLITAQIKKAMKTKVYDLKEKTYRNARFSDICVIMRSARKMSVPLQKACALEDIPLYCDVGGGYFSTLEVSVFLALLHTVDNPQDDISLLTTMRAPFFAFDEDELAQIRLRDKKRLFYFAVLETAKENTALGEKCADFLKKVKKWRKMAAFLPTDTLILRLFEETGYLLFVSGKEGGETKRANLELLFEKANQFEKSSFRGLFQFLRYLERISSRGDDVDEAKLISEADDVVRLMSIHKSKGLEFPIVILAETERKFSKKATQGNFLFHKTLGIGISHIDPKFRIRYDTPAKTAVLATRHVEEIGEELRVLYVALTRAKERLIITGVCDKESFSRDTQGGLSPAEVLHANSFLALLGRVAKTYKDAKMSFHLPGELSEEKKIDYKMPSPMTPSSEIREILEYRYAMEHLSLIPTKISVSEYKRMKQDQDVFSTPLYKSTQLNKPRFCKNSENIHGASFGTLMHFVMETIPFWEIQKKEDVRAFVESLWKNEVITEEQFMAVDIDKLFAFWDGELGKRIQKADHVYREVPFTQTVPASLITGEKRHTEEKIVMQGILDCFFFEKNGIVLVDYKTDAVSDENLIRKRYKTQMDCYAMALRQKYFSEISQKVIYLFSNNGIIEI